MDRKFWHRQTLDEPLFPDLLWSRPENKTQAGKLLIVGGNAHGFSAAAEAYAEANKAGVGTARVLLPDALRKTVGRVFEVGEYAPSTPSGSFGVQALAELLAMANWADAILFPGDLGRNSETAILLEKFLAKSEGPVTLTRDAIEYLGAQPKLIAQPAKTTLVLSFSQLQKLATGLHFPKAFTFDVDFLNLIDTLHEFTQKHQFAIITKHLENIFVALNGEVSSTKLKEDVEIWRLKTAAHASVWQLQTATKPFEALTTSIFEVNNKK